MTDGSLAVELGGTGVGDVDLYQVLGSAALESGLIEFSLFEGYGPVAGDFFGFFPAAGGLTVGDDLPYAFLGVADGFAFAVSFLDEAPGLTIPTAAWASLGTTLHAWPGYPPAHGPSRTTRRTRPP